MRSCGVLLYFWAYLFDKKIQNKGVSASFNCSINFCWLLGLKNLTVLLLHQPLVFLGLGSTHLLMLLSIDSHLERHYLKMRQYSGGQIKKEISQFRPNTSISSNTARADGNYSRLIHRLKPSVFKILCHLIPHCELNYPSTVYIGHALERLKSLLMTI